MLTLYKLIFKNSPKVLVALVGGLLTIIYKAMILNACNIYS